jgi:hypothetical protein
MLWADAGDVDVAVGAEFPRASSVAASNRARSWSMSRCLVGEVEGDKDEEEAGG